MKTTYASVGQDGKEGNGDRPLRTRVMLVREGRRKKDVAIQGPADVFNFMAREARNLDREHFWRIDLNAGNRVLGYEVVSVGTLTASLVHPREVLKGALLSNAAAMIVCHNHPSGDANPSREDKQTTKRLQEAGKLLGVPLLDHVILSSQGYFSFRDRGLL